MDNRQKKFVGFETKKSLGQHFLNNDRVPQIMADAADVTRGDIVVEVGPGTGVLTKELLGRGATVIAIEADLRAISVLEKIYKNEIAAKNLVILHADMRTFSLAELPVEEHVYKVVANIPYYLSGKLFRTFIESEKQPSDLVFLVQKEVAERIARDTKESLLSLGVKVYGKPAYVATVKRGNFTPAPKVDSAVIAVREISHKNFEKLSEKVFFEHLHAGFSSKRKQLLGNLSALYPKEALRVAFTREKLPLDVRGEDLSPTSWLSLVHALLLHRNSRGLDIV